MKEIPEFDPPPIVELDDWQSTSYLFDEESKWAIKAALHSGRTLLIQGEPGVGKSILAKAAADVLGWRYLSRVVNAGCECEDLFYHFDAISRLAEAQIIGATKAKDIKGRLALEKFIRPAELWFTFNFPDAQEKWATHLGVKETDFDPSESKKGLDKNSGNVLLIDEIDKAQTDLPNALLEALGNRKFKIHHTQEDVTYSEEAPDPLIIITTNRERELPDAFIRRCMVMDMKFPEKETLITRALKRYPDEKLEVDLIEEVADDLLVKRKKSERGFIPGQAEFFDLLNALCSLKEAENEDHRKAFEKISKYGFEKPKQI